MTAFVYVWNRQDQRWLFADMRNTEDEAKQLGRDLWKSGVAGIKIDVINTVVEEKRK